MELKDIVSISGMSGLHEVVAKRADGMIVRALGDQKSQFVSSRIHVFTPLDAITIYTGEKDSTELYKALLEMKKQEKTNPPADPNADGSVLKSYFEKILPDYNEEKVYVSDIKKLIRWYQQLNQHNLLTEAVLVPKEKEKAKEEEKGDKEKKEVVAEKTPKAASKPKPAVKDKAATHSKSVAKRTAIGAKRGG